MLAARPHRPGDRRDQGGWISFARYMELALHAAGLATTRAARGKLGAEGDFVTAPELGSLFGRTLARQLRAVARRLPILELGAGSGALAETLLAASSTSSTRILETSRPCAPAAADAPGDKSQFLDTPPERCPRRHPRQRSRRRDAGARRRLARRRRDGARRRAGRDQLVWQERPASGGLHEEAIQIRVSTVLTRARSASPRAPGCARCASTSSAALILVIDYGFPRREYYHPQRSTGTLMCHHRHHAHADPFARPGDEDITAHVDFSALAARRARSRRRSARLRHAGAVPRQLRHHRGAGAGERRERAALRADRGAGAEAAVAGGDGRAVQGARRRRGITRAPLLPASRAAIRSHAL